MKTRLNKFISECGFASRRKSESYILEGRVQVNGKVISELAYSVDENDIVKIDGEIVKPAKKVYFLLNKPKGYITTTDDEKGRKTVIDLIETNQKIFPIGRLDYNTTGVLILTNDGDFANLLMHPSNKVPREYFVKLNHSLEDEHRTRLTKGITLEGSKARFESIRFPKNSERSEVVVKTVEGRNHFVKKMFSSFGYFVNGLERKSYAGFDVKGMPKGSYRIIAKEEIQKVIDEYAS